jgi:hypothetical protein
VLTVKKGNTDVPNPEAYVDYVQPEIFTVVKI